MSIFAKGLSLACSALIVSGCVTTKKTETFFDHPSYGLVKTNHAAFKADNEACGIEAYKNGVAIAGQTAFTRKEAIDLWTKELIKDAR